VLFDAVLSSCRGGSRKLFWEGHIGLESLKEATKRDAEGIEEERSAWEGVYSPQLTTGFGGAS